MISIARTLPFAVAAAAMLLLASGAHAKDAGYGVSDLGVMTPAFQSPSAPLTVGGLVSETDNEAELFAPAPQVDETAAPGMLDYLVRSEASPLPSPTTWAMLLAGFGLAGAALRRGAVYRLVEEAADGSIQSEEFNAPDDQSAIDRALSVAEGVCLELWRGDELVKRVDAPVRAAS